MSHELRIATPANKPLRALVGAFYQQQKNHICQDYLVDNLATSLSVPGWANTLWLTNQNREDKDYAVFGEANWDVTPQVTLTAGTRYYKFDNTIIGFNGFGPDNPGHFSLGYNRCLTTAGLELRDPKDNSPLIGGGSRQYALHQCRRGGGWKLQPKRSEGNGWLYRFNAQWKPSSAIMLYATWSKGFRPGGINRQPTAPAYGPDFLINYEAGWKTTFAGNRIRWNGAIYHQRWQSIQFSYLGANSLTVTQNGRNANADGVESDINYVEGDSRFPPPPPTPMPGPVGTSAMGRSRLTRPRTARGCWTMARRTTRATTRSTKLWFRRARACRLRPSSRRAQRRAIPGRCGRAIRTFRAR